MYISGARNLKMFTCYFAIFQFKGLKLADFW